ncbi:hypothetical protein [Propylenella binzhouense]|uniref:helix-turn-helix domain-containing transcriptional regulator n=1 Tax=Propylenella binzhouense TaxID=2555902 RepID=UPI0031B5EAD8
MSDAPGERQQAVPGRHPGGAFADGDAGGIADALGAVARARGMSRRTEETGLTRHALYKAERRRETGVATGASREASTKSARCAVAVFGNAITS